MALEFLIVSTKLIFGFIALAAFVLSLLFKTMSGAVYYYYVRDMDFLSEDYSSSNSIKMAERFKPILSDPEISDGSLFKDYSLTIKANFFRYLRFKRRFSNRKLSYE